jgi:predicted nucleotide-binding protein
MPPKKADIAPAEIQEAKQPDSVTPPINSRTKVFISYSHENKGEMARLLVHLKAARRNKKMLE